jgi:hypothetical protein
MELSLDETGQWLNKLGERPVLESNYIFPLLKCTDLAHGRAVSNRSVLVTQKNIGEDTKAIATSAPHTWSYLNSHKSHFDARKSSIYNGKSPFSLFGVGSYAFSPWKVAVSGLHKTTRFVLVGPHGDKPVFFDDTCYFLPFENAQEARLVAGILNSPACLSFLDALVFSDSKRPITVDLLQRLNLHAIASEAGLAMEWMRIRRENSRHLTEAIPQAELVME